MNIRYDQRADVMYIELTDEQAISTRIVNASCYLHLNEQGQVVGIELLHVQKTGIDPLNITMTHLTPDMTAERPDPVALKARRQEIAKARKRALQKDADQAR